MTLPSGTQSPTGGKGQVDFPKNLKEDTVEGRLSRVYSTQKRSWSDQRGGAT